MRPSSSKANAIGWRMSGSDATRSARNPSGRYICANVCSPGVRGGEGIGLGFKCWRTGLVLSRSTSGSGFSAMAALVSKQSEHAISATRSSRRLVEVELTRPHSSKQEFKGQNVRTTRSSRHILNLRRANSQKATKETKMETSLRSVNRRRLERSVPRPDHKV